MTSGSAGDPVFSRNVPGTTEVLQHKCVGIAGCGGLGSNAAVSLARAGVGALVLADHDVVELSNLNRQQYLRGDVGAKKVEALARTLRAINPGLRLVLHDEELAPGSVARVFADADLLVEAFDRAESKLWLIESWCRAFPGRPIVCGNGLSGIGMTGTLRVTRVGRITFCGDGATDFSMGLSAARVAIVANMEANEALAILTGRGTGAREGGEG